MLKQLISWPTPEFHVTPLFRGSNESIDLRERERKCGSEKKCGRVWVIPTDRIIFLSRDTFEVDITDKRLFCVHRSTRPLKGGNISNFLPTYMRPFSSYYRFTFWMKSSLVLHRIKKRRCYVIYIYIYY